MFVAISKLLPNVNTGNEKCILFTFARFINPPQNLYVYSNMWSFKTGGL